MTSDPHGAWNDFWAHNSKSDQGGGCLPARWQGIDAAQQACWKEFSTSLPKNARVLDLATGDGRVMRWMLGARRDLKLVGADMAPQLPPPPRGTKFKIDVKMENLPFAADHFAAITSQFGFEYGRLDETAQEAARVVRYGGKVALMIHRQDGPILEHNLKRREHIGWALETRDLPKLAKDSLKLRNAGLAILPPAIAAAPAEGARLYGAQSAAWEIAEAIKRCLVLGARDHPANVARLIDTIVSTAGNELGRIASLEAACATTADRDAFMKALEAAGLQLVQERPVLETGSQRPFADYLVFRNA